MGRNKYTIFKIKINYGYLNKIKVVFQKLPFKKVSFFDQVRVEPSINLNKINIVHFFNGAEQGNTSSVKLQRTSRMEKPQTKFQQDYKRTMTRHFALQRVKRIQNKPKNCPPSGRHSV